MNNDRRAFFHQCLRLLGVGGIATYLLTQYRKEQRLKLDPNCVRLTSCLECPKSTQCAAAPRSVGRS